MKLILQGRNQCQPATLAMLADQPLDVIVEYACNLAGVPDWKAVLKLSSRTFWNIMLTVARDAGLKNWQPPGAEVSSYMHLVVGDEARRMKRGKPTPAELAGKGQMTYRSRQNVWHAVAFENGVIFDGAIDCPYGVDEWMKHRHRKWLTYYISHC